MCKVREGYPSKDKGGGKDKEKGERMEDRSEGKRRERGQPEGRGGT